MNSDESRQRDFVAYLHLSIENAAITGIEPAPKLAARSLENFRPFIIEWTGESKQRARSNPLGGRACFPPRSQILARSRNCFAVV